MDICYTIIPLNSETSKCLLQQASTYQNTELKVVHFILISLRPADVHITSLFQSLQYLPTAPWNNLILYSDLQGAVWSGPCLPLRTYLCDFPITLSAQHTGPLFYFLNTLSFFLSQCLGIGYFFYTRCFPLDLLMPESFLSFTFQTKYYFLREVSSLHSL